MGNTLQGELIRIRGLVQGVGFRPHAWHLAHRCELQGDICNDAEGVFIRAWGTALQLQQFIDLLQAEQPPLARIDTIEREPTNAPPNHADFIIRHSTGGKAHAAVTPDAASCTLCCQEIVDPANRRYRYPFTNCSHCGPRLSILNTIPYDRPNTSMAAFALCPRCLAEYSDPANRRFHAQPTACSDCGPQLWLEDNNGEYLVNSDAIRATAQLIRAGAIVAIKGLGGIQLACDASNEAAVHRLRLRKQRPNKALALMASHLAMVARYTQSNDMEAHELESSAAPIVILKKTSGHSPLAPNLAPGQQSLGFMLPNTPLHHLLLAELDHPIVLTSGNCRGQPQLTENNQARQRLQGIADYFLLHNRDIVTRLDDSVLRVSDGAPRLLRRARGYAPQPLPLPPGFEAAPSLLAMGGELKNCFCLLGSNGAILSPHNGDLDQAHNISAYRQSLDHYQQLFDHRPELIAVDQHRHYHATQLGWDIAAATQQSVEPVQHHHAHIAATLTEYRVPRDAPAVLGIVLDGLGLGDDDQLWGGEWLLSTYNDSQHLGGIEPIALLGGDRAAREPWRNLLAHLEHYLGWDHIAQHYAGLELVGYLQQKPLATLRKMQAHGLNSPKASSCGRLFDAVAAAVGLCREKQDYEGQAAIELEALATTVASPTTGYPIDCVLLNQDWQLQWASLWRALLADLQAGATAALIAARFHIGLADALATLVMQLRQEQGFCQVVLSGGVFQNRLLLEKLSARLREQRLTVFSPQQFPCNDGGLALGQAMVAAARHISRCERPA